MKILFFSSTLHTSLHKPMPLDDIKKIYFFLSPQGMDLIFFKQGSKWPKRRKKISLSAILIFSKNHSRFGRVSIYLGLM